MKTKIHTTALTLFLAIAALLISGNALAYSGNDKAETGLKGVFIVTSLAPVVPAVAEFTDMPATVTSTYASLRPVTPPEAPFTDAETETVDGTAALHPICPDTADFEK